MNCTMWKELQYQNQFPKFYIACDKFVSLNECVRVLTAPDSKGGWLDIKAGDWQLDGGDCPPLHSWRRNQVKWNQQLKLGYSLRYFHLYLLYSFYMCKWSDVTLNESASQFFSGCVLRSCSLDIGDTKTCTRTMRRYCQFKDTHNFNVEVLEIQRHSLFTGHCQPGCTFWQVAERGLDGGTICIFQHSLYGMVWHGGLGGTIYKANVGAWRTHNKDGWSEVQHSLIWQCKLLLWLWIEFSPWNN